MADVSRWGVPPRLAADLVPSGPPVAISPRQQGWQLRAKRAVDVTVAAVVLLVTLPLLVAITVAVKLDSPGPVLFRQRRVGRGAHPFHIVKFRSMRADADPGLHEQYVRSLLRQRRGSCGPGRAGSPSSGSGGPSPYTEGWSTSRYKVAADPRVTRVGRFLRATSLDELPQLVNVLRGEMSLVGPRPDVPYAVAEYEPWMWRRFEVLPGITGLWQVSGRSQLSPNEMLRLDVDYVDTCSVLFDCRLLLKTIPTVLRRDGSG